MFKVLKSGQYKGKLSSQWVRKNSGVVIFTCPKCGGSVPGCSCEWERDVSGFRYRWVLNGELQNKPGK